MKYQRGLNNGPAAGNLSDAMQYSDDDLSIFDNNDTRGRVQGESFPYYSTGAHAVPMEMRQEDAERYRHIWRADKHAPHLEPGDVGKADVARQALLTELKGLVSDAETMRGAAVNSADSAVDSSVDTAAMNSSKEVTLFTGMRNTLLGIEYDLRHWSSLPGETTQSKLAFVFCRDRRMKYILMILIPIFIIVLVIHII